VQLSARGRPTRIEARKFRGSLAIAAIPRERVGSSRCEIRRRFPRSLHAAERLRSAFSIRAVGCTAPDRPIETRIKEKTS
jgi:hypothetical protein